jgi:hypothetical protein
MLSNTHNGSDKERLRCFAFPVKMHPKSSKQIQSTGARSSIMQDNEPKVTVDKFIV